MSDTAETLAAREPSAKYLTGAEPALVRGFDLLATAQGGVSRLRGLIRSLAVQGLLLSQSRAGESANTLLNRLGYLKHARVASSRAKAVQPTNDMLARLTGFALPYGWGWASLSELGSFASGKTPSTGKPGYWNGRIPWVTPKDMKASRVIDSEDHVSEEAVADGLAIVPESAVLIVVRSGILRRTVPVAIASVLCTVNQDLKALTLYEPAMAAYVQLLISGFEPFILRNLTKIGTTVESIKFDEFAACQFPIPPLSEQHRIVARVEELMKLCDALEQRGRLANEQHARLTSTLFDALAASESAHALAENWQRVAEHFDLLLDRPEAIDALEQTIFQLAVRGLLAQQNAKDETAESLIARIQSEKVLNSTRDSPKQGPPIPEPIDGGQPFELPVGWAWARFGQLGEFGRGKSKHRPRNDPRLFVPGAHPLIQTGEISRAQQFITEVHSYYSNEGLAQSKRWPAGTLCITIAANIADSAILSFDACFPDSVVGFVPAKAIGDALYFLVFMKTARQRLIDFAPATAQKNINLEVLNNVLIPLPPFAEQRRIVARVEELRRLCADLRQQLAQARETQSRLADALVAEVA